MFWSPEEGVIHSESPLTRQQSELAPGCSLGGCWKEDTDEAGEAHPMGCSRRGSSPPSWLEEPAFRPPWGLPDSQWGQPAGQGTAGVAGKQ